jgi:putative redox protein
MNVLLKQVDGLALIAKGDSNHWVPMDTTPEIGGTDSGPRPVELLLMALGGCTSMDVISILKKMRVPLDEYECHVEAERATEHPKVFTKIKIKYLFYGKEISRQSVERAIQLSESKYCSVSAMLGKTAEISTKYEIKENKPV